MSKKIRKSICLATGSLALLAAGFLAFSVLKDYSHSTMIVAGPYKKSLFVVLGLIFTASLGFFFRPPAPETVIGSVSLGLGVLWFTGRMVLAFRTPGHPLLPLMDRLMPLPLILMSIGTAFWLEALLNDSGKGIRIPEKRKLLLVMLLIFISLQTVLSGGFNWDDAFFSVEAQSMRVSGESIFQRVWKETIEYTYTTPRNHDIKLTMSHIKSNIYHHFQTSIKINAVTYI